MTCDKKANMKVPSYEPSLPIAGKGSAIECKVVQLHGSPVKEPLFKNPFPAVEASAAHPQNHYTQAGHDKENAAGRDADRTVEQGLDDSGYISLHNSHIDEEDEHIHTRPVICHDERVTPGTSPLKCQQSRTSLPDFTPVDPHKHQSDTRSMSSTPADPSLPIQRFEQAVCKELSKSFQKNKRYDWSIIPKLAEDYNLDRVIGGHMGVDHVDLFSSLLSRNMKCILAQILALLGDMDLISCRKVSRTWRQIIHEDIKALKRCQRVESALRECELSQRLACGLTRDASVSRVVLSSMQRVASPSSSPQPSPAPLHTCRSKGNSSSVKALTPNGTRFNQFVTAASTLKQHESLRSCKRCSSPATYVREAQRATCTRASCQFDFCTACHQAFHGSTPCRLVLPRSHFNTSKTSTIPGSARSKRNIRRL